tara:strand:+ start:1326 stop:1580 length:255 start_codon:yes stop_codon:yes gene_type:complete
MKKEVLIASDKMRLCNVMEAIQDLEEIFSVCDAKATGEGVYSHTGILSPINCTNGLEKADADKIQRMRDLLQVIYAKREKWVLA